MVYGNCREESNDLFPQPKYWEGPGIRCARVKHTQIMMLCQGVVTPGQLQPRYCSTSTSSDPYEARWGDISEGAGTLVPSRRTSTLFWGASSSERYNYSRGSFGETLPVYQYGHCSRREKKTAFPPEYNLLYNFDFLRPRTETEFAPVRRLIPTP